MTHPQKDSSKLHFKSDKTGERLDAFVVRKLLDSPSFRGTFSRTRIQKVIADGQACVDGVARKKNFILKGGELVEILLPPDSPTLLEGEEIDFQILLEDEDILLVSKPAGVVTHPTAIKMTGTLINGIVGQGIHLADAGGIFRPGIVHRLDKETSGVLILAKSNRAYYELIKIFKERLIEKYYSAIVIGNMPNIKGTFEGSIGRHPRNRSKMAVIDSGREAKTSFEVIERYTGFDFLRLRIYTGRTHQIRVHLTHAGHPVLSDKIYGGKNLADHIRSLGSRGMDSSLMGRLHDDMKSILSGYPGMFLHARQIIFKHPFTGETLNIEAPIPQPFIDLLEILRK